MGRRTVLILTVVTGVLAALVAIMTNVATRFVPSWLADPWRAWPGLVIVVLLLIIVGIVVERAGGEGKAPMPRPRLPEFSAPPGSLRPPHVAPGEVRGRESELGRLGALMADRPSGDGGALVVVAGPGGIGKTGLVAAAVAGSSPERAVFWLRWRASAAAESITARMVEVATTLGLPTERVGAVQRAGASLVDLVWEYLDCTPAGCW